MASFEYDVTKQRDKKFILDLNAGTSDVVLPRDLGFTHILNGDTSKFDQLELGFIPTRTAKLPAVELYDKGQAIPFRAKLLRSLHSPLRMDQHMNDFTSLCMSRLVVEPAECVFKVGAVEVPLHPPTMFNIYRIREALLEKHKSMSIILKF